MKSKGPKIVPCGTSIETSLTSDNARSDNMSGADKSFRGSLTLDAALNTLMTCFVVVVCLFVFSFFSFLFRLFVVVICFCFVFNTVFHFFVCCFCFFLFCSVFLFACLFCFNLLCFVCLLLFLFVRFCFVFAVVFVIVCTWGCLVLWRASERLMKPIEHQGHGIL